MFDVFDSQYLDGGQVLESTSTVCRSLVDVVAHEISHSWTGNLVTNVNWVRLVD